jgi:hypothetical protein
MTNFTILNGLLNFLGIAVLAALIYGPLQSFVVDAVRQRFFEIRDGLFDAAARGEISFADPSYVLFRDNINKLLRNAHEITIWRCLALLFVGLRVHGRPSADELLPFSNAPDVVKQAHRRSIIWMAALMWLRSPVVIILSAAAVVLVPIFLVIAATSATARNLPAKAYRVLRRGLREDAALEVMLSR